MGKYVENNLNKNEVIVKKAKKNAWYLVGVWVWAILRCWMLLIPIFKAIGATIRFCHVEFAVTNKRVIGKSGVFNTIALDAPLNKIQNVSAASGFWGKIFNCGRVLVNTAAGEFPFYGIKNCEDFKRIIMAQIEEYEEERVKQQASEMANAMAGALKQQ